MKIINLLLALSIIFVSCESKPEKFEGFGEFRIGEDFRMLPDFKLFNNTFGEEYHIQRYMLSDEIGYVSNLNITTDNGKISEVQFSSSEETDVKELEKTFKNLVEIKLDSTKFPSLRQFKNSDMKFYTTKDSSLYFTLVYQERSIENGLKKRKYTYVSKEGTMKKFSEAKKRFNIK